jgi:hypothetical protein
LNNNNGLCECGCGQKTNPAEKTDRCNEYVKGKPVRFLQGHTNHEVKHGQSIRGKLTATYKSWDAMIQRCTNPNIRGWKWYGGATAPVTICPEWMNFEGFFYDMGERPEGTTLGRILDMGNYQPDNAFWMNKAEQNLAKRNKFHLLVFINKTTFKCGHLRTPENTYYQSKRGSGCRTCANAYQRVRYAEMKERKAA